MSGGYCGLITTSLDHVQGHVEINTLGQGSNDIVRIDNLDVVIELDITCGNNTRPLLRNVQGSFILGMHNYANTFQVEQDVDNVFLDTINGGEFMQHAFDTAVDDGTATH